MSRSATKRLQQLNPDKNRPAAGKPPPSFGAPRRDDQVVSRIAFILGTIMIFLLISAAAVFFGTRSVERDIKAQTESALRRADFQDVTVEVDGFDVALQGFYHESRTKDEVLAALAGVPGIRSVDQEDLYALEVNEIEPDAVTGRPITIEWENGIVTISGDVSSEAIQAYMANEPSTFQREDELAIFRAVEAGDLGVVEDLAPVAGLAHESEWIGSAMALLRSMALNLDSGKIVINPSGKVVITSGEVETRQEKRDVEDAVGASVVALESDGFVVTPGIILPPDDFQSTEQEREELQSTLTELIGDKVVEFELNSAALTQEGQALLDDILVSLRERPNVALEIAGHADASGTAEHNMELSERRAQAVFDYFVAMGEDPARFIVQGYGDTQPIPGAPPEKNRRIEFIPLEGS
jgi:outer membrane protein OmpA-like peptidoglycan-associated protein